MQLGCAPGSTFTSHQHGTWLAWHPDGHICYYLRPMVWVCVCVQPLAGLLLVLVL